MTVPDLKPGSSPDTGELLDGRYLLDTLIGAGGMGVVYRARDEMLGRTVAVKVFRESAVDPARSGPETRLLASLNHSALVTLFDAQTAPGHPNYLVMEFVDGPTLRQRLEDGPLAPNEAALMARDLAEALHVVHQAGIVHRDIKPSNVLLRPSHVPGEEFRAKLADFGIAYLVDSTRLTLPGTLVGTAAYLSPEQVRGAEPAPASDIYALGLVLIEALTGERAFPQTGTHEAALARLTLDPVVPAGLGYPWKSLLTAMTARDPEQRPSALDVVVRAAGVTAPRGADGTGTMTMGVSPAPAPVDAEVADAATAPTRVLADAGATEVLGAGGEAAFVDAPALAKGLALLSEPARADALVDGPAMAIKPALVGEPARADATGPLAEADADTDAEAVPARRAWGTVVAVVVLGVLVLGVIVGLLVWVLGVTGAPPEPVLPAIGDPLGAHLQQLLDSVSR